MKKILLSLICGYLFLTSGSIVNAQSPVLPLGNGLNNSVNCSCTDSLGNVYVVISKNTDTAIINKWSVTTKSWSVYSKIGAFTTRVNSACAILYNKFYLVGYNRNIGYYGFFEINGTKKTLATFLNKYNVPMNVVKFKNKLYFIGGFDSINFTTRMPGIAVFNGSTFSTAGFPPSYVNDGYYFGTGESNGDSLYIAYGDKILKHVAPSSWSIFYQNKEKKTFNSMALNGSIIYASIADKLYLITNGVVKDSLLVPSFNQGLSLTSFKNDVYITAKGNGASRVLRLVNNKIEYGFTNQNTDTNRVSFVKSSSALYYHGTTLVKVKGQTYNFIVQVNVDSLNHIGFDTIVGQCFWDKNKNYKYDGKDTAFESILFANLNEDYTLTTTVGGYFKDIVPNNQNMTYQMFGLPSTDSCLQTGYSGNLVSNNTKIGITTDSLNFPLIRPSKFNTNLALRSLYRPVTRIADSSFITFDIVNKDCNFITYSNGELKVVLDSNVILLSSSPSYTSNIGSTYVFKNLKINYGVPNLITMKLYHPFAKFKLGDKVRHYATLSPVAGEDTLDNKDSVVQRMVYSYDPNVKRSLPEGKITKTLQTIRYFIDFQNEGNDDARTVTVIDTIDTKLPAYEYKMIGSSHAYSMSIQPGTSIVKWVFENINLKPKASDEKASKGYLIFEAKVRGDLKVGDSIRNKASIYFDYNLPITTNYAVISMVKIDPPNNISKINTSTPTLLVYPNPTHDNLKFENNDLKSQILSIFDVNGKKVKTIVVAGGETLQISPIDWSTGLYLIVSNNGESYKLMKE